jgi:hypothetical protein
VEERVLGDLKTRLKLETSAEGDRLLPPLEGIGFQYGFNSKFLKQVTAHWLNKYDWRAREKLLSKYPHFKTKIGGIDIRVLASRDFPPGQGCHSVCMDCLHAPNFAHFKPSRRLPLVRSSTVYGRPKHVSRQLAYLPLAFMYESLLGVKITAIKFPTIHTQVIPTYLKQFSR